MGKWHYYFSDNSKRFLLLWMQLLSSESTGCDSRLQWLLCSAVTLCPLASATLFPTAARHQSAFNHLPVGEIKQIWQHLPTSGASAASQSLFIWVTG